ncbi:MAG: hypothetical protein EOO60_09430 [Hymenobacter sp.]|nr:MAG: hypothetical protein EOO60_09430 [Hymenobacter sp.]
MVTSPLKTAAKLLKINCASCAPLLSGWASQFIQEYCDQESGGSAEHFVFQQLFRDAHQRRFDVLLFWSLVRFSREDVTENPNYIRQLQEDLPVLFTN